MTTSRSADDPGRFLHRIDPAAQQCTFVATDAERLRRTPFLDGRTIFWDGAPEAAPFELELAGAAASAASLDRFIFHVSFCGSTLLATLLDETCDALVLKEPHCLVDLADWRKTLQRMGSADPQQEALLGLALARLGRRHRPSEPLVAKPSNWANNLLPLICTPRRRVRAVFLTMARQDFLVAVFRGGRERIGFTARTAEHLASAFAGGDALIEEAIARSPDPLERVARLAALQHVLQSALLDFAAPGCADGGLRLDFSDVTRRPEQALRLAAEALALVPDEAKVAEALARWRRSNAKNPDVPFSTRRRGDEDAEVLERYRGAIEHALGWASALEADDPRLRPFPDS